jgi:hypothetical protein
MATTTSNPFEPPRTTDLDRADAPGPMVVSAEALRELAATAPWVRALASVTMLTIAIEAVRLIADLGHTAVATNSFIVILSTGGSIAISTLVLRVLRRYAAASARLRDGNTTALGPIIGAQASYFKLVSVLAAIGTGVYIFGLAIGIGSGRFFSWIYK